MNKSGIADFVRLIFFLTLVGYVGIMRIVEYHRAHIEAIGIVAIPIAILVFLAVWGLRAARAQANRRRLEQAVVAPLTPVAFPSGMRHAQGEQCLAIAPAEVMDWLKCRSTKSTTVGGFGRGREGGMCGAHTRSMSRPQQELHVVDVGTLVVTDRRVIFRGKKHTLDVPFSAIDGMRFNDPQMLLERCNQDTISISVAEDVAVLLGRVLSGERPRTFTARVVDVRVGGVS